MSGRMQRAIASIRCWGMPVLFVSFFLPPKCTSFLEKMAIAGELWQTAPSAALETPV